MKKIQKKISDCWTQNTVC